MQELLEIPYGLLYVKYGLLSKELQLPGHVGQQPKTGTVDLTRTRTSDGSAPQFLDTQDKPVRVGQLSTPNCRFRTLPSQTRRTVDRYTNRTVEHVRVCQHGFRTLFPPYKRRKRVSLDIFSQWTRRHTHTCKESQLEHIRRRFPSVRGASDTFK